MVKRIAITGGKGGTGKSTISTALAIRLAENKKVLLIDADVDCPNDGIILGIDLKKVQDVENMIPKIDEEKCIKCGKCSEFCKENALIFIKGRVPIVLPERCSGCKVCKLVCPVGAISEEKQIVGEIDKGEKGNLVLLSGKIKPRVEESSLIVNEIRKYISGKEKDYDYILVDTAAGTHCSVISALQGVDFGLAVTEPTPLGNHDLDLILQLMKKLNIKSKIVLNRSDIADGEIIEDTAEKYDSEIIVDVPYSKEIEKAYSQGIPIKHEAIEKIVRKLENGL